jgi:hypothetical protein
VTRVVRLLVIGVVAVASGQFISASAAESGLTGTITPNCILPGGAVTVTLSGAMPGAVVSIQASYGGPEANEAGQSVVGTANGSGVFSATFTIAASISPGIGTVIVLDFDTSAVSAGVGNFTIGTTANGCPSPGTARMELNQNTPVVHYSVQKTCDAGLSGDAVFEPSVVIVEVTTVTFPRMTLHCNAAPVAFPAVPVGASIKFHETTAPAGAVPAPDVWAGIPPDTLVVIHNAKAAATATATPRPAVHRLPATGSAPFEPAGGLAAGIILLGAGILLFRRRRRA